MKSWIRILVAVLALAAFAAAAQTATLSWTNPTTYDDNTIIPDTVLAQGFFRFYTGDASGGPWSRIPDSNPGFTLAYPATSWVFPAGYPVDGKWYTIAIVVPCDPTLPMLDDAAGTNKCSSDYAVAVQYLAPYVPPPPPPKPKKPHPPRGLNTSSP